MKKGWSTGHFTAAVACSLGATWALFFSESFMTHSKAAVSTSAPSGKATEPSAEVMKEVVRGGEAGFVVSEIAYSLGPDAKDSGSCPAGMTAGVSGLIEAYAKTGPGERKLGESSEAYERRVGMAVNTAPNGQIICMNPEASAPDPGWRLVSGRNIKMDGIDLDGRVSTPSAAPAKGTCKHEDFQGVGSDRGVDNQFYRVVGCTASFQSSGQANTWQIEMYTGSWGLLFDIKGLDDVRNDPDVRVGIYASADPIQLSAARTPLPFATYAFHQDAQYRAETIGRIRNGVLTIDPINIKFINVTNGMSEDRILLDARLRLTFTADGGMEGFLAGYTPVENMYDLQYGTRHGRDGSGKLAPERLRIGTAVGRAFVAGHTCNGGYFALKHAADGHPDASGHCTSISTQYRIRLLPAFVVNARTQSVNAPLASQ